MTKSEIRSKILLRLKIQKEEDRKRKSKIIKNKLLKHKVFQKAKIVMFYISFDGEVETKEMIKEARKLGKIVAVPVCKRNRIIKPCLLREKARLLRGPYGIGEPAIKEFITLENLDLVVVPGVAFDKKGNRLGRGKGYYDKFLTTLAKCSASLGLAFDFQVLPNLPTTKTDVSVERVLFA